MTPSRPRAARLAVSPARSTSISSISSWRVSITASRRASALPGSPPAAAGSRAASTAKRALITAWVPGPAAASPSATAAPWARSSRSGASGTARRRGPRSAALIQTASAPSLARAPRSAASIAAAQPAGCGPGEPPAQILGTGAEGVVEGIEPPDRPADLGAEHPERLGLGAELGGIADHLVADEARGDQVGQPGRAEARGPDGVGLGALGIHGAGPRQGAGRSFGI